MSWTALTVLWTKQSTRDLAAIGGKERGQIVEAVRSYALTGEGDCKPLKGVEGHRIRVRDRRVFVLIERKAGNLTVTAVVKRGDAY